MYLITRSTIKLIYSDKETPMNPLNEGYRPVLEQDKLITQKNILKICQYVLAKDPSTYVSPWKQTDRSTVVQWAETFYFYLFFFLFV